MKREYLFTSESVSEGHPDKVCDQISDAVVDAFFEKDPRARVACETLIAPGKVVVAGEFTASPPALLNDVSDRIPDLVRGVLSDIGYTNAASGFDVSGCQIIRAINAQSPDIALGVDREGAGDQGLMFGYATTETPELMPLPIALSHRLVEKQAAVRRAKTLPWLRPDAKSQVTIRYRGATPVAVETVVLSTQHTPEVTNEDIRAGVAREIIEAVIPAEMRAAGIQYLINPTGRFEIGGPQGDTGLTGRKIIVDTYGGSCPHGGGAFSGKDPTKVDRSACYMARYVAKNVVAAGLAERCTVQIAYAIGVAEPVSVHVNLHQTGRVDEAKVEAAVREVFRLTPRGIIETLDLRRPIYRKTAAYGHFGRELPEFTWERTDKAGELARHFGLSDAMENVITLHAKLEARV